MTPAEKAAIKLDAMTERSVASASWVHFEETLGRKVARDPQWLRERGLAEPASARDRGRETAEYMLAAQRDQDMQVGFAAAAARARFCPWVRRDATAVLLASGEEQDHERSAPAIGQQDFEGDNAGVAGSDEDHVAERRSKQSDPGMIMITLMAVRIGGNEYLARQKLQDVDGQDVLDRVLGSIGA